MQIKAITKVGAKPVFDISVQDAEHYILENGVVTHNTGGMYSANQVFIIGKAQEKDGTDLVGWTFTINIEKSRFVKEKSKLPFTVTYDGGIDKYSGMLDLALEGGFVAKPKNGFYQLVDKSTGELIGTPIREKATKSPEFLGSVMSSNEFNEFIKSKFQVSSGTLVNYDDIESVDDFESDED